MGRPSTETRKDSDEKAVENYGEAWIDKSYTVDGKEEKVKEQKVDREATQRNVWI